MIWQCLTEMKTMQKDFYQKIHHQNLLVRDTLELQTWLKDTKKPKRENTKENNGTPQQETKNNLPPYNELYNNTPQNKNKPPKTTGALVFNSITTKLKKNKPPTNPQKTDDDSKKN